ncbi:MAG: pectinesterase family protein [Chitinophagaceae bacterium]
MKQFNLLLPLKKILFFLLCTTAFLKASAYDKVVAKDGSGDYTTVQAAIDAAPTGLTANYTIYIKNGRYKEVVTVPSNKPFLQLIGESVTNVILTYDNYSGKAIPNGGGTTYGTSTSASFFVNANDFSAVNITFENTTGESPQALAINVNGDRAAFKNCRFLGGQDTVLANGDGKRQYFLNCYIDGTVDFIFGGARAVFDTCVIYPRNRTGGGDSYITAANTQQTQAYGYVFRNCKILSNGGASRYVLGRPWQNDMNTADIAKSRNKVVYLNTSMGYVVKPEGWSTWDAGTNTAYITFAEYKSLNMSGGLLDISSRVPWSQQLTDVQAADYSNATLFGTWDPCAVFSDGCGFTKPIAVANFKGAKGAVNSVFNWNLCWPVSGVTMEIFRSPDNISFTSIASQNSVNDTAVNFTYTEAIPPPGQTYYYYIKAFKAGLNTHFTDTVPISSTPTITATGALGSFLQGVGLPSTSQSYVVSGASLTNAIIITPPAGYEISSNGGTNWYDNGSPISLTPVGGNVANTTISVRLNAASAGSYSGNITHTSVAAASVNVPVTGTVQSNPLTVSETLQQWAFTTNGNDSAAVRSVGVVASTPTFNRLYLSNGTTVPAVPAYSTLHGQAYGATANGDGTWTTASGGPGSSLNRTFYEQFTVTASALYSVRIDSVLFSHAFYNSSSGTKLAIVYSKTGFTTADSTDVTGGVGPGGTLAAGANGAFATPVLVSNETAGTTSGYRIAFNGSGGVTIPAGQTLTFRIYNSCGSGSPGRYGKIKNMIVKGLAILNPVTGDYQTHQSGDWTDLNTWERYDGSNWINPAPAYPVYNNSNTTNILNGHTATISATLANGSGYIQRTKINKGGQIIVNAGVNLNIANDGAPASATTDLQVDGTFTLFGGIFTNGNVFVNISGNFVYSGTGQNLSNTGDSVNVTSTGTYQHNANSNTTPLRFGFQPGGTFLITGLTTSQTDIFKTGINYGNIVWNNTNANSGKYYAIRRTLNGTNVQGSFTVVSTGNTYVSFANNSGDIGFPGGFYQTGGIVNFIESGTVTDTLTLGGDFNISGGTFNTNASGSSSVLVRLNGTNKLFNYSPATAGTGVPRTNWQVNGVYTLADTLPLPTATFGTTINGSLFTGINSFTGVGDVVLSPLGILGTGAATGLNGTLTNSGAKTLGTSGNLVFNGLVAQTTGTLLPATVNSLTVNNSNGLSLSGSTNIVGGALTLAAGKLLLGANAITTSSVTGATSANYIVTDGAGAFKLNNIGAGNNLFPVGPSVTNYNPITINNAGTPDNMSVNVKNSFDYPFLDPTKVVNTQWNITEDVPGGSNASVGLSWIITDQGSNFSINNGVNVMHNESTVWVPTAGVLTGAGTVANPYFATAPGFTSFSPFAVANTNALPLSLLSFNAGYDAGAVKATWATANEVNIQNFIVERSRTGNDFSAVGTVVAKNAAGKNDYQYTDPNPIAGVSYYRLKMVDKSGSFTYSAVVAVNSKLKGSLVVYPNPVVNEIRITHPAAKAGATLELMSIDGKRISQVIVGIGAVQTSIDASLLSHGNYMLVYKNNGEKIVTRFSK